MEERPRRRIVPAWQAMIVDAGRLASSLARPADAEAAARLPGHTEAMIIDACDVAGAMLDAGDQLARRIPGYAQAAGQLRNIEASLLSEFKKRLDDADRARRAERSDGVTTDPRCILLHRLLRASMVADSGRSREDLHLRMLNSLVPDEARILAALSDGTRFPLLHIETRGPGSTRTLLTNASTVGRVAGVHLHSAVPVYVTHLRHLGLVEEGPHDNTLSDQYALLGSEDFARRAEAEGQQGALRGTKVIRRTLRISPLGAELWAACRPSEPDLREGQGRVPVPYRSGYAGPPDAGEAG